MTQAQEFNASTVDDALAKASARLGVPPEQITYEILDEGSPGFLGIGARDARVSVTPSAPAEDEPAIPEIDAAEEGEDEEQAIERTELSSEHEPEPVENIEKEPESTEITPEAPEGLLAEIEKFTVEAVEGMGFKARVEVYDVGEYIAVDVSTAETGLFIGQKGETIDALQLLVNVSAYRDQDFVKRIVVDSEGYRQRRIEAVQGMAHRMARRATREGRTIELPPMGSSERRVIHTYLRENPSVSTVSAGTGDNRRVNISPAQ
ncbi:MAG: RNA-binding cell elongation regulator Jag/EloR [Rubrobacteraceae bacterium]